MKIAFVHDFLSQDGGAEKVLEAMQEVWPKAPTYTLFFDKKRLPQFKNNDIRTSFLQKIPGIKKHYQWLLPLMPLATEKYDLREFDVVISNASAFCKGVLTGPDTLHISYCHTPTRYLWSDTHQYLKDMRLPFGARALLQPLLSALRGWDYMAAQRPQIFLANSKTVQERIKTYYRRDSQVVFPPVETEFFIAKDTQQASNNPFFLCGGRLVPYKRFDLIIEAANRTHLPLIVFGVGPLEKSLKKIAGPTVKFLGRVSSEKLRELYQTANAFIHPQEEDFGITPIEAMSAGCPVIAYGKGGASETVIDQKTGILFYEQNWETLAEIMLNFDQSVFSKKDISIHAQTFSKQNFQNKLKDIVEKNYSQNKNGSVCES